MLKQDFSKIENLYKFWDFRFTIPYIKDDFIISLGEGGTPCRRSKKFGEKLGLKSLYFKDETQNPTNSFKDRAAALLTSHARSWGYDKIICASNGNQGASLAAYTSIEGMTCMNIIPEIIDVGKKAQMIAYDSKLEVKGKTVDDAIADMLKRENIEDFYQGTAELNPLTLEAQKTITYEVIKQVEDPDWILIPMGSGELLVSLWKGFHELLYTKVISKIPKLIGIQSQVLSPIADAFFKKDIISSTNHQNLEKSLALGILVKKPIYRDFAIKCIRESEGTVITIPEDKILNSIDKLIRYEGIFAEPASALTVAALESLNRENMFGINEKIICIITGSGLKAPYVLEAISSQTKTTGKGSIIITKLKILSQVSLSNIKGISGTKIQEIMGTISLAAIYQHLKELESKGLISRKKEGKNVFYFITDSGKKVLDVLDVLITLL